MAHPERFELRFAVLLCQPMPASAIRNNELGFSQEWLRTPDYGKCGQSVDRSANPKPLSFICKPLFGFARPVKGKEKKRPFRGLVADDALVSAQPESSQTQAANPPMM